MDWRVGESSRHQSLYEYIEAIRSNRAMRRTIARRVKKLSRVPQQLQINAKSRTRYPTPADSSIQNQFSSRLAILEDPMW